MQKGNRICVVCKNSEIEKEEYHSFHCQINNEERKEISCRNMIGKGKGP